MNKPNWKHKLENYERALATLLELKEREADDFSELEIAGTIQRFEYTLELAWKTLKAYLESEGFSVKADGPKSIFRKAFEADLIKDGRIFFDMLEKRNMTSHIYRKSIAHEIFILIIPKYIPAFELLLETLSPKDV